MRFTAGSMLPQLAPADRAFRPRDRVGRDRLEDIAKIGSPSLQRDLHTAPKTNDERFALII